MPVTEAEFVELARACDLVLTHPEAVIEWSAIPWLHVINEHPIHMAKYNRFFTKRSAGQALTGTGQELAYQAATLGRNFIRAVSSAGKRSPKGPFDVLIVSYLLNEAHIKEANDFYFGSMQALLADRGFSSLLAWRNLTGTPTRRLLRDAGGDAVYPRIMLPDALDPSSEFMLLAKCIEARRTAARIRPACVTPLQKRVLTAATWALLTHAVIANLRLHRQIEALCEAVRPKAVLTLFEGHGWERLVWNGARAAVPGVLCVGYQHTIMQRHAHAMKRPLGGGKNADPDMILALGGITKEILEAAPIGRVARVVEFGAPRAPTGAAATERPNPAPGVLVLPEGLEPECLLLFEFALDCARRLPEVPFVFRAHPVLPFDKIKAKLRSGVDIPPNVIVSDRLSLEDEFNRAGCLLYRGSSTALYAVIAGIKPFYVGRPGEMTIDPLDSLQTWRERVEAVDEFVEKYRLFGADSDRAGDEWSRARDFCLRYMGRVKPEAVDTMMEAATTPAS